MLLVLLCFAGAESYDDCIEGYIPANESVRDALCIRNCYFDNCDSMGTNGGAIEIFLDLSPGTVGSIIDCFFIRCQVLLYSGYFVCKGGAVFIHGTGECVIQGCCGMSCVADQGCFMYFGSSNLTVSECSLNNCTCIDNSHIHFNNEGEGGFYIGLLAQAPVTTTNISNGFAYDGCAIH
jgi:hypothetical protein